jgi:malonyl-CoA O-methyltransferase
MHGLNILLHMSDKNPPHSTAPIVDAAAVARQIARLARRTEPPWLHVAVAKRMAERLTLIRMQPQALLNWWGYLGASSDVLRQAYPHARQVWIEPDQFLLERAAAMVRRPWWKSVLRKPPMVEVLREQDLAPGAAQMLWANMMLHACSDMPAQIRRWHAALAVDGFLMFSCLGPDSLRELRPIYRDLGWGAPAHDWVDMHDIGDMMVEAGFADPVMDQERITLTWADASTLVSDLRALGGNLAPARFIGLRGRHWYQNLLAALEQLRGADGRLSLTLELVYGHAFKPQARLAMSAETSFSLEQMRALVRRSEGS